MRLAMRIMSGTHMPLHSSNTSLPFVPPSFQNEKKCRNSSSSSSSSLHLLLLLLLLMRHGHLPPLPPLHLLPIFCGGGVQGRERGGLGKTRINDTEKQE